MKKLMMFAAAMTIVGGAHAWTFCGSPSATGDCDIPVWDFKASGKVANEGRYGYKAVNKISLKGVIVGKMIVDTIVDPLDPTVTNEVCCLDDAFNVYIYDRSTSALIKFEDQPVEVLTAFGKYLDDIIALNTRPGRGYTLESDVMWTLEGDDCDGGVIDLQFVGFGKTKGGVTAGRENTSSCGDNSVEGCQVRVDWPSWTGWFTGWYGYTPCDLTSPMCDFDCTLVDAVAGGTWSAKLNKKRSAYTSIEAVEAAMESAFRASVVDLFDLCP